MKKQGSLTPPEEHSNSLERGPEVKNICEMPGKEFKIMIMRKLREI
jgi:hypothetical protein